MQESEERVRERATNTELHDKVIQPFATTAYKGHFRSKTLKYGTSMMGAIFRQSFTFRKNNLNLF